MSTTGKARIISFKDPIFNQIIDWDELYFQRPWSIDDWKKLDEDRHLLMAWIIESKVVGYGLYGVLSGDEAAHMYKIFLLPEWRGKGESAAFLKSTCEILKERGFTKIFLEVEMSNPRGVGFYEKSGFHRLRIVKGYYSDGTDALTMELLL